MNNKDAMLSRAQDKADELDHPKIAKFQNIWGFWFLIWLICMFIIGAVLVYTSITKRYWDLTSWIWVSWLALGVLTLIVPVIITEDIPSYKGPNAKRDKKLLAKIKQYDNVKNLSDYDRLNIYNLLRIAKANKLEDKGFEIVDKASGYEEMTNQLIELTQNYFMND